MTACKLSAKFSRTNVLMIMAWH